MGVSFKKIFKENEDELVVNRSNKAIRVLIFMAIGVVLFIIAALILKFSGDKDAERRTSIIQDIKVVKSAVENIANDHRINGAELKGSDLTDSPIAITVNGIVEEYRYGYYLLTPEILTEVTNALNLPLEYYIVNYDTYDVINYNGVKYNKMQYYSIEDLLIIEKGMQPTVKQIIRTAEDLEKIRANPNGYFKLSGNIDLSAYSAGEGWKPIEQFGGTLDGRGYTISNLTIHRPSTNNVGLFGELTGTASITNLKFENVDITGGQYVGTLSGIGAGNISYVDVYSGNVSGQTNYTGGLVGSQNNGTISNCILALDSVKGNESVGGIVGIVYSGTLTKCGTKTNVTGKECVGGVIGNVSINSSTSAAYIQEVFGNVQIIGNKDLGGIVGRIETLANSKLSLKNSYSKGAINGTNTNAGGLVGSVSTVGAANIEFYALYTALDILEKGLTSGGCIGYTDIAITSTVSFSDCFWEKDLAPGEELKDVGSKVLDTFTLSFDSKTVDEMRIRNTFVNWDFDIWGIDERESTPYLKWAK